MCVVSRQGALVDRYDHSSMRIAEDSEKVKKTRKSFDTFHENHSTEGQ
jgi:hypothetical protein